MKIWIFGELTYELCERVCRVLSRETSGVDIVLNSHGGLVNAAVAIHDALRPLHDTRVIATGYCGSAANLILQAGETRMATPSTQFYFHPVNNDGYMNDEVMELLKRTIGATNLNQAIETGIFGVETARNLHVIDGCVVGGY